MNMKLKRPIAAALGFGLLVPLAACYPGEPDATVTQSATDWLVDQQQPDGGFEKAGFAGFETPDAIFALAEQAQTGPFFDTDEARARIVSIATGGKNALDNIDDLVDGATEKSVGRSAQAAKIAALVALPLGLDANDFDPGNDSPGPVDLIARINEYAQPNGSLAYGAQFNGVLYAAIALSEAGEDVPDGLIDQIINAQRSDGSWNYVGSPDADPAGDVDTTSLALSALASNGLTVADRPVGAGVVYLAGTQQPSGAWSSFDKPDPNSTAVAAIVLSDLHIDVTNAYWRAQYDHPFAGDTAYVSPYTWLNDQQASDGHIASANDEFGLNTFGTSQAIQSLSRQIYLDEEYSSLTFSLAYLLMTDGDGDGDPSFADATVVSDAVGPNASIVAARTRGAAAAVNSQAGREEAVNELFQQALNRPVDPSGRASFSAQLVNNDRPSVLLSLVTSGEFAQGRQSNSAYVDGLYQRVLGRNADAGGKANWVKALSKGTSRASVARSFIVSNEYRINSLNDVFVLLLGRPADNFDRYYGLGTLADGRIESVIAGVGGSAEYYEQLSADGLSNSSAKKAPTFSDQD